MVKVKSRERDDQSIIGAAAAENVQQQTARSNDELELMSGNARKRQKQQPIAASALSFSIESIMRSGNNNNNFQSTNKQTPATTTTTTTITQSSINNKKSKSIESLVIDASAPSRLCVGVESPSSDCSSVRSNGNVSQNSSTCMSRSASPPLECLESPSSDLNGDVVEENEDSNCDSPQSRLSSPISPGNNRQQQQHQQQQQRGQHLSLEECKQIQSTNELEVKSRELQQKAQNQSGASSKKSSSLSDSSRHSSGGSTNPLLRDRKICDHPQLAPIESRLDNLDLWHRFHPLDTEMIITKQGRRMFPPVKVNFGLSELAASSLSSRERYHVLMDVLPFDGKRYRYAYHKSSWQQAGKADPPSPPRLFLHPDGPFTLEQLRRQVISFEKIKLTNNDANKHGYIVLNSMHKYQPRIHLMLYRSKDAHSNLANAPVSQLNEETCKTFIFSETIFTAVTAYQNHSITKLKIDSNPFAKGFRDSSRLTDFELESMQDLMSDGPCPFSPPRPPPHGFTQFMLAAAGQHNPNHFAAVAAAAAAAAASSGAGPEDPTASLFREQTMMALDSIFQQQQRHFHHQQTTPTSHIPPQNTTNNNNNPNFNSQQSNQIMQQQQQQHIQIPSQNKPTSPLTRSSANDQNPPMTTTTTTSTNLINSSANCSMPNLVNMSSPFGASYSFSHAQQQQQQQQFLMSSHLDQLLQLHGNPFAAAVAAAAMASSQNPSHSQQQQQAPPPFGLLAFNQAQQYNSQSPPYMPALGPPAQQHASNNRTSQSPCNTPTSPLSANNNNNNNNNRNNNNTSNNTNNTPSGGNSYNNNRQSPQNQQQIMCPPMSQQNDTLNSCHYQANAPAAPPGLSHSQLQDAMFAAAQHQQQQMAALSMQFEREHQIATALARHQHLQKGAPASMGNATPALSTTTTTTNLYLNADDATAAASQKLLNVNQLQQSVNSLLDQQQHQNQLNNSNNLSQARHTHSTGSAAPANQFK